MKRLFIQIFLVASVAIAVASPQRNDAVATRSANAIAPAPTANVASDIAGVPKIAVYVDETVIRFDILASPVAARVDCHYFSLEPYPPEMVDWLTWVGQLSNGKGTIYCPRDYDHDLTRTLADSGRVVDFWFAFFDSAGEPVESLWTEKSFILPNWGITIPQINAVDVHNSNSVPASFDLEQNYPNPFNPSTTIQFSLEKNSLVKLTVYNMLGEQVATLIDGYKNAGTHEATWNAGNMASGFYFYRLEAGNTVLTRKMILMK